MNIISSFSDDTKKEKPKAGSYEWWYFDAQSVDGYKIVVIFYDGNPFSRRYIKALEKDENPKANQFPAISISVYQNDKPIFYSFKEVESSEAKFSSEIPFGKIGSNRFSGNQHQTQLEYEVTLQQKLACGDSIKASLTFRSDIQSLPRFPSDTSSSDSHLWNLIMPSGYVEGEIHIDGFQRMDINFFGLGYHDHNLGFEPLKDSFQEWYWGRYYLENSTFIYYLMKIDGEWKNNGWMIGKDGTVLTYNKIELSNFRRSLFGLKTARSIEFTITKKTLIIQLDDMLDSGPFYQRFGGRLIPKDDNGVTEANGISEYINPVKIYEKKFWPLVNMRIAYPGKPHWVQKNPRIYRWTW